MAGRVRKDLPVSGGKRKRESQVQLRVRWLTSVVSFKCEIPWQGNGGAGDKRP